MIIFVNLIKLNFIIENLNNNIQSVLLNKLLLQTYCNFSISISISTFLQVEVLVSEESVERISD